MYLFLWYEINFYFVDGSNKFVPEKYMWRWEKKFSLLSLCDLFSALQVQPNDGGFGVQEAWQKEGATCLCVEFPFNYMG